MNFKASYKWIKDFYDENLPDIETFSRLLTMSSSEVDGVEENDDDFVLDIKVLPSLAHSCLCHRGIAKEYGALSGKKVKKYSRIFSDFKISESKNKLSVKIHEDKFCRRYIGRLVENIEVKDSPVWLKEKLESIGQRSINNIVDATNFVMLELGQPMHAFDADKLKSLSIDVRKAKVGEKITTLDNKDVELDKETLLIANEDIPLAIAGIKGGNFAEVDKNTKNIVLESANFDPVNIRKTSQRINIKTDASKRYENEISPEIAFEAMDILTRIISEVASNNKTLISDIVDVYPRKTNKYKVGISTKEASSIVGIDFMDKDLEKVFDRLCFFYEKTKVKEKVLTEAKKYLGAPYSLGSSVSFDAPNSFDCSSFTSYIYVQSGISLPRISIDQYVATRRVEEKDLQTGDLVFMNSGNGKIRYETVEFVPGTKVECGVDHCGIYIGEGKIIHATVGKGVVEESISSYKEKIVGFGRHYGDEERYVITVPDERLDIRIKEDLAEEIGRVFGYDKLKEVKLPDTKIDLRFNKNFYYSNKVREVMSDLGFSEVNTYTFVETGDFELANPMSPDKSFLRNNLTDSIKKALELNSRYSELVEMPQIRIFEISHIFSKDGEKVRFIFGVKTPIGVKVLKKDSQIISEVFDKIEETLGCKISKINKDDNIIEVDFEEMIKDLSEPEKYDFPLDLIEDGLRFKKISSYPFIIRDVAVFTPEETKQEDVLSVILKEAGSLVIKNRLFDVFTKKFEDGSIKTSYAFRLIFQSFEKTLSDDEINVIMDKVYNSLNSKSGWKVR